MRYLEIVEGGFSGGDVVPRDYAPSPEMFNLIRANVGKADLRMQALVQRTGVTLPAIVWQRMS